MNTIKSESPESNTELCCSPTNETALDQEACCVQPADGSACCDKGETQAVNAEKTGCC